MFAIFEKLGGREKALDVIAAGRSHLSNPRPSKEAEKVWRRNRKLPALVQEILAQECERRGIEYSLADFRAQVQEPAE